MDDNRPEGRRNIGRPQTRWGDVFSGGRDRPRDLSLIVDDEYKLNSYRMLTNSRSVYYPVIQMTIIFTSIESYV